MPNHTPGKNSLYPADADLSGPVESLGVSSPKASLQNTKLLFPVLALAVITAGLVSTFIGTQKKQDLSVFAKDPIPQVQGASFIAYTRNLFTSGPGIIPSTTPGQNEILSDSKQLKMHASRNESESVQLGIYNNGTVTLKNVSVSISAMKQKDGSAMLAPADIRIEKVLTVRKAFKQPAYKPTLQSPEVLLPAIAQYRNYLAKDEFEIRPQTSKAWIITLKTDASTPAGTYEGTVTIASENAQEKRFPITLTVSGMELFKHPIKVSGFYYKPLTTYLDCRSEPCAEQRIFTYTPRWTVPQDEYNQELLNYRGQVNADLSLLKGYSMRSNVYTIPLDQTMRWENNALEVDFGYLDVLFEEIKAAGMNDRPIVLFRTVDSRVYKNIQKLAGRDNVDEEYKQLVSSLEQRRVAAGMSQLYWYPIDEPFHNQSEEGSERRAWLTKLVPLIRSAVNPNEIYVTIDYDVWFAPPEGTEDYKTTYGSLIDIPSFNRKITSFDNTTREEFNGYLKDSGKFGYMYVNHRLGDLYDHRLEHGLFFHNLGLKANIPYTYQSFDGNPYADDTWDESKLSGDWTNAYPDLLHGGQPLPTLRLIAIREGIDDLNYIYTLRAAKNASTNQSLVKEAQKLLEDIHNKINEDVPSVSGIRSRVSASQMDKWRREIAKLVVKLGQPQQSPPANDKELLDEEEGDVRGN